MVFLPPAWPPQLSEIPDSISIPQFMFEETYGRCPLKESKNPFTCGLTGRTYTTLEMKSHVEHLARALSNNFLWQPNRGSEWDKIVGIYSLNTLDFMILAYAVHRLSGIAAPASAASSHSELEYQLKSSGAKALFTCIPLLETALKAARGAGIPQSRVYILELPKQFSGTRKVPFRTVWDLIAEGSSLPPLEALSWQKGQGARQVAYICFSSGTSGLPKGVMISHRNVIANVLQVAAYDKPSRDKRSGRGSEVALGLLPMSHIYGLVTIAKASTWRGDAVIILPKYELTSFFNSIQQYKIESLYLVPPIIIQITKNPQLVVKYDMSSVKTVFSGAAPLSAAVAQELQKIFPSWVIRQGYGLTETSPIVCNTSEDDVIFGSSGSLLPGVAVKLMSGDNTEITDYDTPGELLVQSPSVVLGYLNNEKANKETFVDEHDGKGHWLRTGDEAVVRRSPGGNEHIYIQERIKELIKVNGLQVAPAELEAHLLSHPSVADCAVIGIPNGVVGEVPKAFIVKSPSSQSVEDETLKSDICKFVQGHKSKHKWLTGGVAFVEVIPKNPTGKILRRLLKDNEKVLRRAEGTKL
ncbi:BgTH12-02011 [Blumeria graminis f. sp. triticale]|uniref:Bgt-1141 n=3 Tax=Blumeria graminis TaxID=34373 RepID=A0A381LJT5_BLUGR|nr:Peroxisomal AMP-binding protein [Blumeria graminis f. sp. tritici 96224]CAD6501762.1 BgTH12-02011 [Blumeria graminis f. sp. triticale]VDB84410.1 Bgt-1141 [Blumeria graminis f. sp. tritici]